MSENEDNDQLEKTSVVQSDTFKGRLQAASDAPPVLVILVGPQGYVGKQFPITKTDLVIGRSVECDIFIDDKSLSRSHAKLALQATDVAIIDLGSTNKTVVNTQTLPPLAPCILKNNDQIKTGNIVFKFLERGQLETIAHKENFEKANKDALTGAYSKGALLEKGPEAIKRSEMLSEALAVVTFDIDHFKKINDNFGHPGGDYVLRELSKTVMTRLVRANDYFARFGGEEFVLILAGSTIQQGMEIGERIRQTIQMTKFEYEGKLIPVTVSVGVSQKNPGEEWDSLYDRADKALYISKQSGRNRVTRAN